MARKAKKALNETEVPEGYIVDFISGQHVRSTPEEVQAVQVFARRLVQDFGYPPESIQTRPQFRVRQRPSDEPQRGYPVDIAVFSDSRKREDDALILVECKRKDRKDGEKQLRLYLTMSSAQLGAWFNGQEHLYLRKIYGEDGSVQFCPLPTLPRFGQSIHDIGQLKRKELTAPHNLRAVFRDLRNHLAGNTTGITRDQALAEQIMALLFCKIFDELDTEPDSLPRFRAGLEEPADRIRQRIEALLAEVVATYPDVFSATDTIELDDKSLAYVVGELQPYAITQASRDAVGDAFEVFIGPAVRGEEGQFFTPRNVVSLMVRALDPGPSEVVVDPACGSGGFLIVAIEHIWAKIEAEAKKKKWSATQLERRKRDVASRTILGIDKDAFLTKVAKAYMAIIGDGRGGIFCEDALDPPDTWRDHTKARIAPGKADVVLTNPPFGSKIKIRGHNKLAQYDLARSWSKPSAKRPDWEMGTAVAKYQVPQVLFIERCAKLLRPGGRMGIILPESLFGMPSYGYVVKYLLERYTIRGFVSLPEEIFQPHTHAKTCIVILENSPPSEDYEIQMAVADWCGHDSRGNPTTRTLPDGSEEVLDDLPKIADLLAAKLQWTRHD